MPKKSYRRKSSRRSPRRKSTRRSYRRKLSRRSPRRKTSRRSYRRRSSRRSPRRKSTRRSPRRKSSRRSSSRNPNMNPSKFKKLVNNFNAHIDSISGKKEYNFYAYYEDKPNINYKLKVNSPELRKDDDYGEYNKQWVFSGFAKASSASEVENWLKSLGRVVRMDDGSYSMNVSLL